MGDHADLGSDELPATPEEAEVRLGRRVVLGVLAASALGVLAGGAVQRVLGRALAPLAAADPTGLSGLIPAAGGFRIYSVSGTLPDRSRDDWRLSLGGLVDRPAELTFADLMALPQVALTRDFQCVTGWRVDDVEWRGVRLRDVIEGAGVAPAATALSFGSFDGVYTESLTLDQARLDDVILAHTLREEPLPARHGGPVRLLVAPMYGYKSLKWLDRIDATATVVPGYWERRGYDVDAFVGRSNDRDDEAT